MMQPDQALVQTHPAKVMDTGWAGLTEAGRVTAGPRRGIQELLGQLDTLEREDRRSVRELVLQLLCIHHDPEHQGHPVRNFLCPTNLLLAKIPSPSSCCYVQTAACWSGWDNNGKPGNQVATKSLPSSEIFGKNTAFLIIYVNLIY